MENSVKIHKDEEERGKTGTMARRNATYTWSKKEEDNI